MKKIETRIWNIESRKSQNSKFQIPNSNFGFTLMEVVMVLFLGGICGTVIVNLFLGQNQIYKTQTAELIIMSDGRSALDDISNYVRSTNRVLSSYSSYTAGLEVLILQIQSINASNGLIAATFDQVVYYLDSGSLYRQVFPNASSSRIAGTKKLASSVNSLAFTYNNIDFAQVTEVDVDITLQKTQDD